MDKLPVRVTLRMDEEMHQMLTDAAKRVASIKYKYYEDSSFVTRKDQLSLTAH